jgi:UDP-glucose 4-epimerase
MRKKRILITGANGFVGSSLIRFLGEDNFEIIPIVRRKTGLKNEMVIDFCDVDFCRVINKIPEVDSIVHLGAKVKWNNVLEDVLFRANVLPTAELANWAKKIDAKFIFASTAIVCGAREPHITSKSSIKLDTSYGRSKWLAEELVRMSGAKHTILRISGVFGNKGPVHLGINKSINDALNGVPPVLYGSGGMKRNYIYVKDLCNAIKYCIEKQIIGTHFAAGSTSNTISEMLKVICETLLPGAKLKYVKAEDGNDQTIETTLDIPKNRSFKDAIKDIAHDARGMSL